MENVLAMGEKYSELLGMSEFLADPNADPRIWLRKNLELNQKKGIHYRNGNRSYVPTR